MSEPNRLSAPGEGAALERVEEIAERIDEVPIEQMALLRTHMLSPERRGALVLELDAEADRCGRRALLEDARNRVRQAVLARLAQPLYLYSGSPQRADDVSYLAMSIVDAVAVAVMEDRLSLETASLLSNPGRSVLGLAAIAAGARMPSDVTGSAVRAPEPTAEDWAEAAAGETQTGDYAPVPVGVRVGLATMGAVVFGSVAVFVGVGIGQTGAGLLVALAIVAVCWLIATYHRA